MLLVSKALSNSFVIGAVRLGDPGAERWWFGGEAAGR
ncbi:hypothetical protein JOD49_001064 [Oerskovia jenensis]|uniref:Uncharacterized protein n=1 Tax=Oerskovia jenensis TaxID=162169 RepID=A0ABS2LDC4_9CELL|nr:hypothetical protein [Oerskovia jenensis]